MVSLGPAEMTRVVTPCLRTNTTSAVSSDCFVYFYAYHSSVFVSFTCIKKFRPACLPVSFRFRQISEMISEITVY